MSNQFRTEQVRFEETVTDDLIRQFQRPENVEIERSLTRKEWKEQQTEKTRQFLKRKK